MVFAQVDADPSLPPAPPVANFALVTGLLDAQAAPSVALPVTRIFVDITAFPDKDIIGWTWTGGATFAPPSGPSSYSTDIQRIAAKVGAITNG